MFLLFSLCMLLLVLLARFRSPAVGVVRVVWFFISLLPSELPWAFAIIQMLATLFFIAVSDIVLASNLLALAISAVTLWLWFDLHQKTFTAKEILSQALEQGARDPSSTAQQKRVDVTAPPTINQRRWLLPFYFPHPGVEHLTNIAYGSHSRQQLDIYRPADASAFANQPCPVLLHVHGGGWMLGHKHQQGLPLMHYLAQHGWICVDINYRLAPKDPYPQCLLDVKTAIAWLKQHIAEYGGDPDFIALTGGSAGAHLCTLAALTPDHPEFQPGFEHSDTRVQAVVAMYGIYDLTNSTYSWSDTISKILQQKVMAVTPDIDQRLLRDASPKYQINADAPPMLIIHGTTDNLVFVEDAREFSRALREVSSQPVLYAELPGAQHGFDLFHCVRAELSVEAVGKFLRDCYINRH
jgi:acetyl esterase/lipase